MEKVDLKKELAWLYAPSAKNISLVEVPDMNFVMVDGKGAPEGSAYQDAVQALYSVAYTIKFARKKADGIDFPVMALEGLWWADDYGDFQPGTGDRNAWQWTMMIMQPEFITKSDFNAGVKASGKKDLPSLGKVRFERFKEGKAAQLMHIGPYLAESPNIKRIHDKVHEIGGQLSGKHHEIYLSDPRRADPAKLKTVLRQPYTL
jgi:hypothetical protein